MNWEEGFVAPATTEPFATGSRPQEPGVYPAPQGAAIPEEWSVTEWKVDIEETPLAEKFHNHVDQGMEFVGLVSDYHARRGTGKSTLSIKLAEWMDRTDEGLTPEKVTNTPEEFIEAYVDHEKGSGLIMDEAEAGANARDAMTNVNKMLNERVSMGRVGEKYSVWNMPDIGQIDKEIRKLAHFWFLVTTKGRCRVYQLNNNPFEGETYPTPICELEWGKVPHSNPVYKRLDEHKKRKLSGEDGEKYVPQGEVKERVERAEEEASRETRNEFIYQAVEIDLLTQGEISDIVGLSQSAVSTIYNDMKEERAE